MFGRTPSQERGRLGFPSIRFRRSAVALGTAALLAVGTVIVPGAASPAVAASDNLSALVNPFVGTESEGNAYPGATRPFGMVQLSPDNSSSYGSTSYSNFAGRVWGFSHRHINSAGCPAAGEVLVTPTTTATPQTTRKFISIKDRATTESARAGYYGVTLANDVRAELTATERTGVHRYTFPAGVTSNLSFNIGQTLRDAGGSSVTWVDDRTLEGWVDNGGFCGSTPKKSRYFFSASFDRAPASKGTWSTTGTYSPGVTASDVAKGNNGAVATFDTTDDRDVEVSVGASFVSVDGARNNRVAEVGATSKSFDEVLAETTQVWDEQLAQVEITASDQAKTLFYTQLYKALISPTIGSDVDGQYRGQDLEVHKADGWTYYQTFSLWDTYRTQATLHALFATDRAADIVRSMYQHRIEGKWLPRWSLGPLETNIMAGDPVTPWIAENFAMGTVPEDISDELWDFMIENATTAPPAGVDSVGRQSAEFWMANRHIPFYPETEPGLGQQFEEYRHGGSSSMEFAISDAAVGAAAQRLGKTDDAAVFLERGRNWQRLWNPDVPLTGGFQGIVNAVTPTGGFVTKPEKADVTTSGFHEATTWQYQWMANQDITGLQKVMGGKEEFLKRLDYYFAMDKLQEAPGVSPSHWARGGSTYYTSIGYNPGNEPTIMNPWLYNAVGEPEKVNDVLAANLNRFPNTPNGGVGNDDLGTLASWYVMASLGFQPVVPGSGILSLNAPRVEAASVTLDDGKKIEITAAGANERLPSYIKGATVNGVEQSATWIDVTQISKGGSIDFELVDEADGLTWGTDEDDWMPSVSDPLTVTADLEVSSGLTATAEQPVTLDVATIGFTDAEFTKVPVAGTLTFGDLGEHDLSVREEEDAWVLTLETTFVDSGVNLGTLKVEAADVPAFAPDPFVAIEAEVSVDVAPGPVTPYTPKISLSAASAAPGDVITVTGTGLAAGEGITMTMHSEPIALGKATAMADGTLKTTFTVPAVAPGKHTVVIEGAVSGVAPGVPFEIVAAPGSGGLPVTGAAIFASALVALLLIGAGTALVMLRRRRAEAGE